MPMPRSLGGTKMPFAASHTVSSPITMRPELRPLEPGEAAQRRGLAAAGWAEQREQLAGLDARD